ncbi:neuropeptides capa receptor-like [Saccostrea cucullata]|uniref:neuropeptides capa receptor-like n=1 Tax=Saccostrea cuccullata TaxID=36930 RepID=UPI002ED30E61
MPHFARRVSTYMYLLVLCILDLCVLHLGLLVNWLREILEIDLHSQSNFSCKTLTFLGYVCSDSSVWLVVAVTFERFMTMCHPLKATSLCRIRQALLVIIFILVFIFLINLHIFWTIGLIPDGNNSTVCGQQKDITLIWPCVDLMVYFVIPFLSTGIFNYKIIRKIRGMKRNSQRNISLATVKAFLTKKTNVRRKLTVMMVILSLTFVITTFPMVCMLCVTAVLNTLSHPLDINRQLFNKMFSFAELLMFTNHAINFYLYVASSRKFRKALRQVLCECKVSDASVFEHSENKNTNNYVAANTLYS